MSATNTITRTLQNAICAMYRTMPFSGSDGSTGTNKVNVYGALSGSLDENGRITLEVDLPAIVVSCGQAREQVASTNVYRITTGVTYVEEAADSSGDIGDKNASMAFTSLFTGSANLDQYETKFHVYQPFGNKQFEEMIVGDCWGRQATCEIVCMITS